MPDTPAEDAPQTVAAFNGHSTPARQTADGVAAIADMIAHMPRANAEALAMVLQQVQVQTRQHLCAQCASARITWQVIHERELKDATAKAAQAHGLTDGDPRLAQVDPAPFLPEQLQAGERDGIPPLYPSVTTVGGTEFCSEHIPGRAGPTKLVVAQVGMSPSALAGLG